MFIPTGADVKSRDKFAEEIEKAKLSNLEIVDNADDAETIAILKLIR